MTDENASPTPPRRYTIGTDPGSDIEITGDDYTSPRHAEFWEQDGRIMVRDCGSTNGTWIDPHRTRLYGPTPIPSGVAIRVGRTTIPYQQLAEKTGLAGGAGRGERLAEAVKKLHNETFVVGMLAAAAIAGHAGDASPKLDGHTCTAIAEAIMEVAAGIAAKAGIDIATLATDTIDAWTAGETGQDGVQP